MRPDAIVDQQVEPHEYIVNGDRVLVRLMTSGAGAGSGVEMSILIWTVWTFEDGQVVRSESFLEEAKARQAAGLAD
jgi:ketosteroid isomerase-like protein